MEGGGVFLVGNEPLTARLFWMVCQEADLSHDRFLKPEAECGRIGSKTGFVRLLPGLGTNNRGRPLQSRHVSPQPITLVGKELAKSVAQ